MEVALPVTHGTIEVALGSTFCPASLFLPHFVVEAVLCTITRSDRIGHIYILAVHRSIFMLGKRSRMICAPPPSQHHHIRRTKPGIELDQKNNVQHTV